MPRYWFAANLHRNNISDWFQSKTKNWQYYLHTSRDDRKKGFILPWGFRFKSRATKELIFVCVRMCAHESELSSSQVHTGARSQLMRPKLFWSQQPHGLNADFSRHKEMSVLARSLFKTDGFLVTVGQRGYNAGNIPPLPDRVYAAAFLKQIWDS